MKFSRLVLSTLAAAALFASCQSAGADQPLATAAKKSVTITIANMAPGPATRAAGEFTDNENRVPVAKVSALNVLFAASDGTVLEVRSLASGIEPPADPGAEPVDPDANAANDYVFHRVDARARLLAVTNIAGTVGSDLDDLVDARTLIAGQQSGLDDVLVWGKSATFEDTADTHVHPEGGTVYDLWDAGSVTVEPALARIEIGNVRCFDLGGSEPYDNGMYPRFATIQVANIGIDNTPLDNIDGNPVAYTTADEWTTAKADAAKWIANPASEEALTASWNIDPVAGAPTLSADENLYAGEVFVYNIAPGAVPRIMLEVTDGTWNSNAGPAGTLSFPYFVKSTGLSGVDAIEAGHIYRVNFGFKSQNVTKLGEDDTLICVDVTVTIPAWVVENDLTPTFD